MWLFSEQIADGNWWGAQCIEVKRRAVKFVCLGFGVVLFVLNKYQSRNRKLLNLKRQHLPVYLYWFFTVYYFSVLYCGIADTGVG